MELVAVFRLLWDRRALVVVGAVLAVAAAALASRSGSPPVSGGVATARLMLDTAESQLVKAAPKEVDTAPMRANLIAELIAGEGGAAIVAREARVPERELTVIGPSGMAEPSFVTPLVTQVTAETGNPGTPYVLRVHANPLSPIVSIEATAPDVARARALADAGSAGLAALVAQHDATGSRGFTTEIVSPTRTRETVSASRRKMIAVAVTVAVFCSWCGALVLVTGIVRQKRRARLAPHRA